jgi:anti-sigma factor ChrR (cupin superfamily)
MPLPQDINPLADDIMDSVVKASKLDWIETKPGMAWMKVLFVGAETGTWVALFKWKKGFVAAPHKHLSASHTYVISGKLQVRDGIYDAGDYVYEANGMVHDETRALEDTEYLFVCHGPLLFFDGERFTGYMGWEELTRMRERHQAKPL